MIKDRPANAETLAVSGNETELSHLRQLFAGSGWSIHTAHAGGSQRMADSTSHAGCSLRDLPARWRLGGCS
jgi:hypothetical protein